MDTLVYRCPKADKNRRAIQASEETWGQKMKGIGHQNRRNRRNERRQEGHFRIQRYGREQRVAVV